ncbi:MAG: hypothetical protein DME26_17805 [Verrucomicrobia bacterium]|nr:MAG: hypothetical protein DME26_17805 [Verrucomicrobiota bacterium]
MNVKFLVGDPDSPEGPRGFFRFYRDQWDEKLFGPRPVLDPLDLLEKDSFRKPIADNSYNIGGMREYWACLNNPHWRQVLKDWVRFGIAQGVDGFVANYFYRHDCHCPHCVAGFRQYLGERFTAGELKQRFAITNLDAHQFDEIVAWHDPAQSTPLRREMLRFSQVANKRAFDDVFVQFGRSLKPDLIVAQWNHLGDFNQINGDERCLLPGELWGRDEDYLWYSTGAAANFSDLAAGVLGEATLQARYIRGAFQDKPFTLGKYESVRIRVAIAELAANGGAPMGFYTSFKDPEARREIVRYYSFLRRHEPLYRANRSHAEVLLLFPRSRVYEGDVAAVGRFKELGKRLLDAHVLFDILPDDSRAGVSPATADVSPVASDSAARRPDDKRNARPTTLLPTDSRAHYLTIIDLADPQLTATNVLDRLPSDFSHFDAPRTVRISASRPRSEPDVPVGNEITLHFVNYNREELTDKKNHGSGIKDEKPIVAPPCPADLKLGPRQRVSQVEFLTPEGENVRQLEFKQVSEPDVPGTRLRFRVPEFLVYGVVRIQLSKED